MNVGVIAEQELEPISVPIRFKCAVKIYGKRLKTQIAMFTLTSNCAPTSNQWAGLQNKTCQDGIYMLSHASFLTFEIAFVKMTCIAVLLSYAMLPDVVHCVPCI